MTILIRFPFGRPATIFPAEHVTDRFIGIARRFPKNQCDESGCRKTDDAEPSDNQFPLFTTSAVRTSANTMQQQRLTLIEHRALGFRVFAVLAERDGQRERRSVTIFGKKRQTRQTDSFQDRRHIRADLPWSVERTRANRVEDLFKTCSAERRSTRQQFMQDHSQAPDVRTAIE